MSAGTVSRAMNTRNASQRTIVQLERIKDRLRTADEFKASRAPLKAPRRQRSTLSWSLETIRAARDAQMRGDFQLPVALAKMMRTDDAIFVARNNRLAPQSAIATELVSAGGARGDAARRKAMSSCITPRTVLQGIAGDLADHGVAIGYIKQELNEEGTRTDFELTQWPLEHVKQNESTEQLETRVDGGAREIIQHGNGRWIVFKKCANEPWTQEAAVLPGALIWAAHAEGLKDWVQASTSHGQAKIIGELPEGVALQDDDGNLTPEAEAFLELLQDLVSGEVGAGLRPHATKTEFVSNGSNAWQVFMELIMNREKAAARVYLGTDAILGSVGGAPGVDIAQLFGVATTKIQGDFEAIEQGLNTGLFQPWAAVNEGDSRYAPRLRYLMPDPDASKHVEDFDARLEKLLKRAHELKAEGMAVEQPMIDRLCKTYNIDPPIMLAPVAGKTPAILPTPSGFESSIRVREMRAAGGLDPTGDPKIDEMFMPQFTKFLETSGETAGGVAQPGAPAPAPAPAPVEAPPPVDA